MKLNWIAVDWGTSNLRIWAMDEIDQIIAEKSSDQGMGSLAPDAFEDVLLSHIQEWIGDAITPIIACGMVGSRQGWQEAPYSATPTAPIQNSIKVTTNDPRLDVHIISGIKQNNPADVMRGEETQIAGFMAENVNFEGVICLPGTHSKWVEISNGKVSQFQTALTGELFALLCQQSTLRHSLGIWDDGAYIQKIEETIKSPETAFTSLFSIRAHSLLEDSPYSIAEISGTLIGSELAGMVKYWKNQPVTLIGNGELVRLYALALKAAGQTTYEYHADNMTLNGLKLAYREVLK